MPPKKAAAATAATAKPTKKAAPKKSSDSNAIPKKPAPAKKTASAPAKKTTSAPPKKPTPKAAPKATTQRVESKPRANISRKRQASNEDKEGEAPVTKKVKADTTDLKRKATKDAQAQPNKRAKSATAESNDSRGEATTETAAAVVKKATTKATGPKPAAPKAVTLKIGPQINFAPTQPLDIFVFGEGESGELGLGNKKSDGKKPVKVKRPRLHHLLPAKDVGVVQLACGGMHTVALTKDNKILTWGVNDQGALGRDTAWEGGVRDADADSDDESEEFENMNPIESTPAEVDTKNIAPGIKFVKVVASDSASFALTEDGRVYGWGTFRVGCFFYLL